MSMSQNVDLISGEAGSACTVYRFVKLATDKQWDMVAVADAEADGVCAESQATVGAAMPIATLSQGAILKIELGATLSAGDVIASDNVGRAIAPTSTAGNYRLGKLIDGGGSGEVVRMVAFKERDEA